MSDSFRILIPTDFSDCARQALAHGRFLANRYDADIHLLHAVEFPAIAIPDMPDDILDIEEERALESMDELLDELDVHHERSGNIKKVVRQGKPSRPASEVILSYASANDIDLIVIGTHGRRGPRRMLLGSVAEEVARGAHCPVFAVRDMGDAWPLPDVDRILVPVDFTEYSDAAVSAAADLARHFDADIRLIHVVDLQTYPHYGIAVDPVYEMEQEMMGVAEEKLKETADELSDEGFTVGVAAETGHVAHTIVDYADANSVDLIVVGSHGRSGLDRVLLGSVAEKVLRSAHCPVVIART